MNREELVDLAKLAEQAERYEDMKEAMVKIIDLSPDLNTEERNLLSVAFKNIVGAKRSAYRVLSNIQEKETSERKKAFVATMLDKTSKELHQTCQEMLKLLDNKLIKAPGCNPNTKVFYLKMKGDYHRYLAEARKEEDGDDNTHVNDSLKGYEAAVEEAKSLKPTDPIRLGLALNFSVFYYEILHTRDKACDLAKSAFDDAIAELDSVEDKDYKDSTLIMQLLRDNLTLWTSDEEQTQAENPDD